MSSKPEDSFRVRGTMNYSLRDGRDTEQGYGCTVWSTESSKLDLWITPVGLAT